MSDGWWTSCTGTGGTTRPAGDTPAGLWLCSAGNGGPIAARGLPLASRPLLRLPRGLALPARRSLACHTARLVFHFSRLNGFGVEV